MAFARESGIALPFAVSLYFVNCSRRWMRNRWGDRNSEWNYIAGAPQLDHFIRQMQTRPSHHRQDYAGCSAAAKREGKGGK
jgi:hypothetical protein